MYQLLIFVTVGNQILNRNDFQIEFLGQFHKPGNPGHAAVIVHYLAQYTERCQSGQPAEIYCGFGMSGSGQNAAIDCLNRKNMTRSGQIIWFSFGIDQRHDGLGSVLC